MCVCVRSVMRTLWDPMDRGWDFPGRNIGVGYHFLLQGLFPYMHLLGVLHWQADGLPLAPLGGLRKLVLSSSDRCFPGSVLKNPPANAGDVGSIPGSRRPPGGGNGNPLQYSCLGNPMDRGAWQATVTRSQRVAHD